MARDFHAVQAQHAHAAPTEIAVRVGVVAQRQPGRRFGGTGGGYLQVEALDAAVRPRGDVEAVAPALARAGGEQPVAAAADLQQASLDPPSSPSSPPKEVVPGAYRAPLTHACSVSLARLIR